MKLLTIAAVVVVMYLYVCIHWLQISTGLNLYNCNSSIMFKSMLQAS